MIERNDFAPDSGKEIILVESIRRLNEKIETRKHTTVVDDILPEILIINPEITSLKFREYIYLIEDVNLGGRRQKVSRIEYKDPYEVSREKFLSRQSKLHVELYRLQSTAGENECSILLLPEVQIQTEKGLETRYIPLMDMMLPISKENLLALKEKVRKNLAGFGPFVILETGNSYHLIGLNLLTRERMYNFFGACLLMDDPQYSQNGSSRRFADTRYIGHSLNPNEGGSANGIRLTATRQKPVTPHAVALVA